MAFYDATFDFSAIIEQQQDIEALPKVFETAMLKTAIDVEQTYLPRLQATPPERGSEKFRFTTPKSRRKWFQMLKDGEVRTDGKHYIRTGGYVKAWRVEFEQAGNEYRIELFNNTPAAKYIGGERQVPGHSDTGWVKYHPYLDEVAEFSNRRFFNAVKPYV